MKNPYEDIINLPKHSSSKHPQMPIYNRAAQFSPFAALVGHEAAISEAARRTEKRPDLDEYIRADIDRRLAIIEEHIDVKVEVTIVYFKEDELKDGGAYMEISGHAKKIDKYEKLVLMEDRVEIPIKDIIEIDCRLFSLLGYSII